MFFPPMALGVLEHFGIDVVVVEVVVVFVVAADLVPALIEEVTVVELCIPKAGDVPIVIG